MATSSNAVKKPFNRKKEANAVYGQKGRDKGYHHQVVGAVMISNPTPVRQQQRG